MKRLICLLCAFGIACMAIMGFAAESGEDIKYNYKLSFEDESEFTNKYGWASAHPDNPNFPDSMKPTASVVSDGKFGNAYQIINPFFYCDNYYGITWRLELKQVITPMPGEESERLIDYMKEVKSINYWVRLPYSEKVEQNVSANTRRTRMTLTAVVAAPTLDDPNHTKSLSFRADVRLKNTDHWQYVQIPIHCFAGGGMTIVDYFDSIQKFMYLDIEPFNDKSFFGELPDKPELNPDGTVAVPAPSWSDRSKDVPILFDELVFDRSTKENPAYTKPSPGEEENLMNANFKTIYVKGEAAVNLYINDKKEVTIPVPPSITALTDEDVVCVPEVEPVLSDLDAELPVITTGSEQIRVGAVCAFVPPDRVPGTGELTVTAGDGITCNRYKLNFVHQEGIYAGAPDITGLDQNGQLTSGIIGIAVPLYNAGEEPGSAVVAATVTDTKTGAVKASAIRKINGLTKDGGKKAVLEIPAPDNGAEDCVLKVFVFDDIAQLHLAAEPFVYGAAVPR